VPTRFWFLVFFGAVWDLAWAAGAPSAVPQNSRVNVDPRRIIQKHIT